jgi:sugar/nucleoside kinase (ribokinase family)
MTADRPPSTGSARVIVGTGGIGSGMAVALVGDRDLGREESRAVHRIDARDYCKLHIVFHYLQRLVGDRTLVLPIGRVGDDETGRVLVREMAEVGLPVRYVTTTSGAATLYSVAFVYPNGDGGNLTTADSASARVDAADVRAAEPELRRISGPGIAVALPEVPVAARVELLRLATELGYLRVASLVPGEADDPGIDELLGLVDLLVVNAAEAAALSGGDAADDGPTLVRRTLDALRARAGRAGHLVVTGGARGSWAWDGAAVSHAPAILRPVRSTAGAGDAHLAGIVTGLAAGWGLAAANGFASLVSSVKVGSVHTIHPDLDWALLEHAADAAGMRLPASAH